MALLFVAVATFSYGFWNGKNIRGFGAQVSQTRSKHDLGPQIGEIEKSFRDNSKKDISQIRDESRQFSEKLDGIIKESEAAKKEIENLKAPKTARDSRELAIGYYSKVGEQAGDLKGIIDYMGQIIETAAVFGEISESASLDEMKNLIARAKEKAGAMKTDTLPENLQANAQNLKESMGIFLVKMEDMAALKSENSAELDASYGDFSQKENEFFSAAKNYIDRMENLDIMEERINNDLERLSKIKFSLK